MTFTIENQVQSSVSLVPHAILSSTKFVEDARCKNEEILKEESYSWIYRIEMVDVVVSNINIFSKQNVATSYK